MHVGGTFFTVMRENFSPDIGNLDFLLLGGEGMSEKTQKPMCWITKKKKKVIMLVFLYVNSTLLQWRIS